MAKKKNEQKKKKGTFGKKGPTPANAPHLPRNMNRGNGVKGRPAIYKTVS